MAAVTSVDLLSSYIEDHARAAALVKERRPVGLGILCFLLGGFNLFVAQALAHSPYAFTFAFCGLTLLVQLASGFLLAAAVHLFIELRGFEGNAASLFILFGLAELSWAVAVPLLLLAGAFFPNAAWAGRAVIWAVGVLVLVLKVRGIRDNYGLASAKAWVAVFSPYMALAAALMLALFLAVIVFLQQAAHFLN